MTDREAAEGEKATSLRRGLALLLALSEEEALRAGGLGVVRLAELVGSDKSRVSRTLRTLAEYDLVERDPDSLAYRSGWRLYALAQRAGDSRLLHAAPGAIRRLVAEFDEGAHLSVLTATGVLTVLSEAPSRSLSAASHVGRVSGAHCTSAGRALLLDHHRAALERRFGAGPLPPAGPRAPSDLDELEARLAVARARGVALVHEESEAGVCAAGAPVRDARGRIVAALNVSAPSFRFEEELESAAARVRALADELSRELGLRADEDPADTRGAAP